MTQKNLVKTLYLVFLSTLGTVWPWISAQAQHLDTITADATFPYSGGVTVKCTTLFTCSGGNCQFDCKNSQNPPCTENTQIPITPQRLVCTRLDPTPRLTCLDGPLPGTYTYRPFTNVLVTSVIYNGPCNCDRETLVSGPQHLANASTCSSGNRVFPSGSSQGGTFSITGTSDSPQPPPR